MKVYIVKDHPILQNYRHIPVGYGMAQKYYGRFNNLGLFAVVNLAEDDLIILTLCDCIIEVSDERIISEYVYYGLTRELT